MAATGDNEGAVVVADEQTAGRGRRGHAWFSPAGSGLYVSVVLMPARARVEPMRATLLLTLAAGVALAEAIETETGLNVDLKWPNDIYVGRRKLAGVLAEGTGRGSAVDVVVLGYGINLRTAAYPPELADRATSLESEIGRVVDRQSVLVATLDRAGAALRRSARRPVRCYPRRVAAPRAGRKRRACHLDYGVGPADGNHVRDRRSRCAARARRRFTGADSRGRAQLVVSRGQHKGHEGHQVGTGWAFPLCPLCTLWRTLLCS